MNHRSNARALERLEKRHAGDWDIAEIVAEVDIRCAIKRMAELAQILAGTRETPVRSMGNYAGERPAAPRPQPSPLATPASASPGPRKYTKDVRPGPHDVLTWEEVLQVPWIDGTDDDETG